MCIAFHQDAYNIIENLTRHKLNRPILYEIEREDEEEINKVKGRLTELGFKIHESRGAEKFIIGAIGDENILRANPVTSYDGVEEVLEVTQPFKLASRDFKKEDTIIDVKGASYRDWETDRKSVV